MLSTLDVRRILLGEGNGTTYVKNKKTLMHFYHQELVHSKLNTAQSYLESKKTVGAYRSVVKSLHGMLERPVQSTALCMCSVHVLSSYKTKQGAGEVAQWLRALAILLEDPGLISSTRMVALSSVYNSASRGSDILLCPPQTPVHMWYTDTHASKKT